MTLKSGLEVTEGLVPFERLGVVSYLISIVTMAVSITVYEIFSVKECVALKTGLEVVRGH